MSNTIFIRSPYIIGVTGTAGQIAKVELKIWNSPSAAPATATRILSKPIPSATVTTVYFDISPYIREYVKPLSFTESAVVGTIANNEFANASIVVKLNETTEFINSFTCLKGFSYFQQGYNSAKTNPFSALEDGTYFIKDTTCGSIYFDTQTDGLNYTATYSNLSTGATIGTIVMNGSIKRVPYALPASFAQGGNKLVITNPSASVLGTFIFVTQCEQKYTPINCDYINKFGVWQRLVFFKVSKSTIDVKGSGYNFMSGAVNYSITDAKNKELNINGKESIKVNTGFVPESYSGVIKQLMLSETILLDNRPVRRMTNNMPLPTAVNQRNINYELVFDYANPIINSGI